MFMAVPEYQASMAAGKTSGTACVSAVPDDEEREAAMRALCPRSRSVVG
jgi:hypothetical protein